jgi:hypothetical protein
MKLLPFTVSVKLAPPTRALLGEIVVIAGTGLVTGRFIALEIPPPGAGVDTLIEKFPGTRISLAAIWIVS